MSINKIIENNLKLMNSREKGGMRLLLVRESIGGNAGTYKRHPCAGANFIYIPQTGEIICFQNWQHLPEQLQLQCEQGILGSGKLQIAKDFKTGKCSIIDCFVNTKYTPEAQANLEATIAIYNKDYGFELEKVSIKQRVF